MSQLGEVGTASPQRRSSAAPQTLDAAGLGESTRALIDFTSPGGTGLARLPALDGLRGVAVLVVVAFHAGFDRMVGGYLGVSTFFTLSGFLIGSLLLAESAATGRVGLRAFWGRRFRRLLPASLLTLAAVMVVFGPLVATADQRQQLGGDVFAALFDVANWKLIFDGSSYSQLFIAPSPVLHFWSLSIEEQFYLLFPILLFGLWRFTRGRRSLVLVATAVLVAAFTLEPFVFSMSDDRIYFGTDTRAPELLLGVVLAVVLASRTVRRRLALRLYWRGTAGVIGIAALSLQAWWWWGLDQSTSWLYRGGFAVYAALSCAVIVAAALPSGPIRVILSFAPLRWVGARSYAIYLFHWPLLLTVWQLAPDLSRVAATAVAVGATFVLAELSYRLLERPVQLRRWPVTRTRSVVVAGTAFAVVAGLTLLPLPVDRGELSTDFEAASVRLRSLGESGSQVTSTTAGASATTVPAVPGPRITVAGDSSVFGIAFGLSQWATETASATVVTGDAVLGCPVARFRRIRTAIIATPDAECRDWPNRFPRFVAEAQPDVVILNSAVWHLADVELPGSTRFSAIGDPAVDAFIEQEFVQAADTLASSGAMVVLLTWPQFGSWAAMGTSDGLEASKEPQRTERFNQILGRVAAQRPDTVRVLDLAGWLGDRSQDRSLRHDGSHFENDGFAQVSRDWFGPALLGVWAEWWRAHRAPPPGP